VYRHLFEYGLCNEDKTQITDPIYYDDVFKYMNIKEDAYPKKYSHPIRRLQKAASDGEMKKRMDFYDGMLDDLKES